MAPSFCIHFQGPSAALDPLPVAVELMAAPNIFAETSHHSSVNIQYLLVRDA